MEEAGFGKYSGDPNEIARTVSSWLASPGLLQSMQQAAIKASRPHATLDIAKDIAELLFTAKQQNNKKLSKREVVRQQERQPVSSTIS